ncbi:MAG: DUF1566 domain-containing protein [Spirochaetales bacterium]|jgi:hypothetical protein|nr:DUF1566 domain-containing protein [Spirochaetales bacterium]
MKNKSPSVAIMLMIIITFIFILIACPNGPGATVETPVISMDGLHMVSITCATSGATVHYTTDGSDPTTSSDVYSAPFSITHDTTVKAIAMKAGYVDSAIASENLSVAYCVGEIGPAGGYVFYDKLTESDGWRYLEAAPAGWSGTSDDPIYIFGYCRPTPTGSNQIAGTDVTIGTGEANTITLVEAMGGSAYTEITGTQTTANYAVNMCATHNENGFDDWFLPSKDELNLMYQNLYLQELGSLEGAQYWSSSEGDADDAWEHNLYTGNQENSSNNRGSTYRVRPVRAF